MWRMNIPSALRIQVFFPKHIQKFRYSSPSLQNNASTGHPQIMTTLLGPPEVHNLKSKVLDQTPTTNVPSDPTTNTPSDPKFNSTTIKTEPPMGLTENNSPTFLSSGNPCLDFFFHVVPDTPPDSLLQRLDVAWSHNPLTTLKLICNLRGVRGTGKSDREGFYTAALWLHAHHPRTLAANVPSLADFGYFKDLPEILYRLLEGLEVREIQKMEYLKLKDSPMWKKLMKKRNRKRGAKPKEQSLGARARARIGSMPFTNADIMSMRYIKQKKLFRGKKAAIVSRKEKRVPMAKKLLDRYNSDADFRRLHDRISYHFAECLKKDLEFLNSGLLRKISLAAKWCPSIDYSFDRSTLLCESIARRVFPREGYPEYEGIEEAHYAYRIRDRLRKDVLVPLRKVLELPEVYIGANRWDLIPYSRVASVAMKLYKEKFLEHDWERFVKYLEDVRLGKATIAAGALLPHEIIGCLKDGDGGEVAELQWSRMVRDMLSKGKMKNCMAVCDVSGSMRGIPMDVSVALGLLVSELSEEPWKGKVVTFSANPQLHLIQGDDLRSKTEFIRRMDWGMNTDFQRVFDLMLEVAVNGNLRKDQMIKRLFVFSDMEFDQASANSWETDYRAITRKYSEKGYGSAVPQIVFWNLRDSMSTPVLSTQKGVALVSGFSKNLLTLFLDNDGEISPEAVMEAAISGPEYQKLVVLD